MPKFSEARQEALQELTVQYKHRYLSIPCLLGGVGIGKTEMAAELAIEMGEKVIEDALVFEAIPTGEASDPTDTAGIPWVIPVETSDLSKKDFRVLWALNRAAFDACHRPTMLLFDDIDKATPIVTNSLLHLFVHRRFKDFALHPKSLMMCAGNRTTDDIHANAMSESLKTRVTAIEVDADFNDFVEWANNVEDGKPSRIVPVILGFLNSKPELLHKHEENVIRFPTPRGYREASLHMQEFTDPKLWLRTLTRKIGQGAANDFWAWYSILSKVDVDHILEHGTFKEPIKSTDPKVPVEVVQKMAEFAGVFAVTDRLNKKMSSKHKGLDLFIESLSPELRVAFLLQLRETVKREFKNFYPKSSGKIMGTIIKDSSS
jgi:hypothetical protein